MCYRCWFVGDPVLCVYTLRTKLEDDGLSDALIEICKEIQEMTFFYFYYCLDFPYVGAAALREDSNEKILKKLLQKYHEFKVDVLHGEGVNWKQVEGELRQLLLEFDSVRSVERRLGIKSMTWCKVFKTREGSIPEPIRNSLHKLCMEIEAASCNQRRLFCHKDEEYLRRYLTLGHDVLEMEIVDWRDIRKSLQQIIVDWKKKRQGITVEDLDGKQHSIYTNLSYINDAYYLVNQVADRTGISKKEFVLVYGKNIVIPGKHLYIPVGAKVQLLPLEKDQKPPTNVTTFVRGIFYRLYGKIDRLFKNFPKVFEDTTRLLSEKDFAKISQLIGKGWGMLGLELGLTKVKLQQIKEDKQNAVSRIFEMLSQWSQERKDEATAGQLLSAVMKSEVSCEFDKLKRALLIGL